MTSGQPSDSPAPEHAPAKKRRRHYIAPEMPYPHTNAPRVAVWKKLWFWLFAVIALLIAMPAMKLGWNILRPDTAKPAPAKWPEYRADWETSSEDMAHLPDQVATQFAAAKLLGKSSDTLPFDEDIRLGRRYDETATNAFLKTAEASLKKLGDTADTVRFAGPARLADIAATDGYMRANCARNRAMKDSRGLAETYKSRVYLAGALTALSGSAEDFAEALAHEREVLSEIRSDAALLVTDAEELKNLLAALARHAEAPSPELARAQAAAFDAALDETPDATLRAIAGKRTDADTGFVRLALAARKPNEHRRRVSELLRHFGEALAKPTFAEARRALPAPGETQDIRLATVLLRDEVLRRLGGDHALKHFFPEQPSPGAGVENFVLKFFALSDVEDPFGEALLLHRRGQLLALIARRDRTRFEAAATACALAIEYRRAGAADGLRPKDTDGLFVGLLDRFPLDPFTDEPPLYSRKKLTLHSPGADDADLGGLEEPEFASELVQLWEPTVSLEPEPPTNPAAFGLKASDLDKPVIRASDAK